MIIMRVGQQNMADVLAFQRFFQRRDMSWNIGSGINDCDVVCSDDVYARTAESERPGIWRKHARNLRRSLDALAIRRFKTAVERYGRHDVSRTRRRAAPASAPFAPLQPDAWLLPWSSPAVAHDG